jgi:hypothetical protein
MKFSLPI